MNMTQIKMTKTERGFPLGKFEDLYSQKCSIQQSSLATENALWLGLDDAEPRVMASKAAENGVETKKTTGWVDYPIPKDVLLSTRMHLSVSDVEKLVEELQHWLKTGELEDE